MAMFALMILFLFIVKRAKGGSFSMGKSPVLKNIATLSLGPKKSLALIEVYGQWILVGVGSENISLISKMDKPSDYDQHEKTITQEGNVFDSFLTRAGLKQKTPVGSSEKK